MSRDARNMAAPRVGCQREVEEKGSGEDDSQWKPPMAVGGVLSAAYQ
jgi:hypothetical protein